jgi:hypothetical protein
VRRAAIGVHGWKGAIASQVSCGPSTALGRRVRTVSATELSRRSPAERRDRGREAVAVDGVTECDLRLHAGLWTPGRSVSAPMAARP